MDTAEPPKAVGPPFYWSDDLDPFASLDLDRLVPRLNKPGSPASIRSDQRLRAERSSQSPVVSGQYLHEPFAPATEGGFLEFRRRVLPIDFADDDQVGGVNVYACRAAQIRQ